MPSPCGSRLEEFDRGCVLGGPIGGTRPSRWLILTRVKRHVSLNKVSLSMSPKLGVGIICSDSAIREQGTGKITLVGCFQAFNSSSFPFVSHPFFVTALIEDFSVSEQMTVKASVEDSQGFELGWVTGQVSIQAVVGAKAQSEVPLPFRAIRFESPGEYTVRILVAEQEIGRRPLFVRSFPQLQGTSV
jgi:hypothetical protein